MQYSIAYTSAFKKDVKTAKKRGKKIDKLFAVIEQLATDEVLPAANREIPADRFYVPPQHRA